MDQDKKTIPEVEKRVCQVCGSADLVESELRAGVLVRPALGEFIRKELGRWDEQGWICEKDLQQYRYRYVEALVEEEKGELTSLEREVLDSIRQQDILAVNPIEDADVRRTAGQILADQIASFGGSWVFILLFFALLLTWMAVNSYFFAVQAFDPYPYILLNLMLSCLAAIQAPIIMMSQNRQEERDRLRATHDYQVNLKAKLEIRHLHQEGRSYNGASVGDAGGYTGCPDGTPGCYSCREAKGKRVGGPPLKRDADVFIAHINCCTRDTSTPFGGMKAIGYGWEPV